MESELSPSPPKGSQPCLHVTEFFLREKGSCSSTSTKESYNNVRKKVYISFICGLPGVALVVKDLPADARDIRDTGLIPGLRRSPGEGYGNPLQYSCLENPMDRGAWKAIPSMGSQRVRHNCSDLAQVPASCICTNLRLVHREACSVGLLGAGLGKISEVCLLPKLSELSPEGQDNPMCCSHGNWRLKEGR